MQTIDEAPFRLGIIGTGIVAGLHVEAAARLPHVDVVAVCDVRLERALEVAAGLGAAAHADYRDMLRDERLDGVVVTSPHLLHAEMTRDAAAAGVAVLVEKPMATTVEDATSMIDACRRAGVALAVGHVLRFEPSARAAADVLASGRLGAVLAITHRRTAHYAPGSRPDWFFDPRMAGGGIAMNVGPHALDRIQWFGGGRVAEVSAHALRRGGLRVETDLFATLRLDSGVTAELVLTSAEVPYLDETVVLGERGSLRCSAVDGTWIAEDGPEVLVAPPAGDAAAPFAAQLDDFAEAARTGRPPHVDGAYGRSIVAGVLAAYASSERRAPVAIPALEPASAA
jgi:predicted dehydrogenase